MEAARLLLSVIDGDLRETPGKTTRAAAGHGAELCDVAFHRGEMHVGDGAGERVPDVPLPAHRLLGGPIAVADLLREDRRGLQGAGQAPDAGTGFRAHAERVQETH